MIDVDHYGQWVEEFVFEFTEPLIVSSDMMFRNLDVSNYFTQDSDTPRDEVVSLIIEGVLAGAVPMPMDDEDREPF